MVGKKHPVLLPVGDNERVMTLQFPDCAPFVAMGQRCQFGQRLILLAGQFDVAHTGCFGGR
ncbi:hypothetical protein D9M71_737150 [compost metagenome]